LLLAIMICAPLT